LPTSGGSGRGTRAGRGARPDRLAANCRALPGAIPAEPITGNCAKPCCCRWYEPRVRAWTGTDGRPCAGTGPVPSSARRKSGFAAPPWEAGGSGGSLWPRVGVGYERRGAQLFDQAAKRSGAVTCTDLLSGEAVRRHSVVQTDPAVGMAQNFSCSNYYTICNPTISPSQLELGFSQSGPLGGSEGWNLSHFGPNNSCTCGAWTSGSGSLYYLWASGNSSIASILSGGAAANSQWYGQYGGQTTASFSVTGPYGVACQVQAPAAVLPNVTIQVQSGFVSMAGNGLILLGGPGGISSTAITANGSPSGGTVVWNSGPRIQISGINSINASASGTGASSSGGDTYVGLTYTVNGQSRQASTPFTVLNLTLFNATS